ncbi:MAG: hypothetical protein R2713_24145 [Ilumatobacteraceae bacterium]
MLDELGPDVRVWWSKITRLYTLQAEAGTYNGALDQIAAERSNLVVWDWPAAQAASGIAVSWGAIHLRRRGLPAAFGADGRRHHQPIRRRRPHRYGRRAAGSRRDRRGVPATRRCGCSTPATRPGRGWLRAARW